MGHRKKHAPHRGSLGYVRKKARRHSARWRNWPNNISEPRLLGFAGYKAGMTHLALINTNKFSPFYKQEEIVPVTVIETPPIAIFGIKLLDIDPLTNSKRVFKQIWAKKVEKDLSRRIKTPKRKITENDLSEAENQLDQAVEVRVLAHTIPNEAGLPQKTPDIIEIKVSGPVTEAFNYTKDLLGKRIEIGDVFKPGDYLDVIATTKGKGYSGVIKRHHVKILPRKTRKGRRVVACIGPWHPARVMWTVPRAGQLGYFARTEYNKTLLKISNDGEEINPPSGFKRYGLVKSHILVKGSVPGSIKRLIRLRSPVRPLKTGMETIEVTYVSKSAKN